MDEMAEHTTEDLGSLCEASKHCQINAIFSHIFFRWSWGESRASQAGLSNKPLGKRTGIAFDWK